MGGLCEVSGLFETDNVGVLMVDTDQPSDLNPVSKPTDDCSYGYVTKQDLSECDAGLQLSPLRGPAFRSTPPVSGPLREDVVDSQQVMASPGHVDGCGSRCNGRLGAYHLDQAMRSDPAHLRPSPPSPETLNGTHNGTYGA